MTVQQDSGPLTLLRPLILMAYSIYYLPITIYNLLTTAQFGTLLSPSRLKSEWFATFWAWLGPQARENAAKEVSLLLHNNAKGSVLDIGPGSGQWLHMFANALNPSITKIYGIEPNKSLHAELRANAVRAGLGDKYEIIGCGAEELASHGGIQQDSIDTIITVQCLCSIPHPERIIKELYPLLKPGGIWLVYEHIRTPYKGYFVDYWQLACNIVWPHCVGGCNITRPTDQWLIQAGEWRDVSLRAVGGETQYDTIPHIVGTLTKAA